MTTTTAREPVLRSAEPGRVASVSRRSRVLEPLAVLVAGALLAIALTWPLAAHLGDHTLGDPRDAEPTIAWLAGLLQGEGADRFAISDFDRPGPPFADADAAAADGRSPLVYGPAWLAAEAVGEVAAYNLVVLLGLVLSAGAMYWLARALGAGTAAAAWAGLAFTVLPWHLLKAEGHPTLVHLEGLPLLVLAALFWFRRPRSWRIALVPAATAVLWLTSVSLGVVGTVAALVLVAVATAALRARSGTREALVVGAAAGLSVVVVFATFVALVPSRAEEPALYLSRYGARPWEYVVPAARNAVFGDETGAWLEANRHDAPLSETSLYVGWTTIALAAGFLLPALLRVGVSRERRFLAVALAGCLVASLVLSVPSPFPGTDLSMPVHALWKLEPSFALPSRFVVLVATALVAAAALGLESLRRSALTAFRFSRTGRLVALALCVTFAGVTYLELAPTRGDVVPYPSPQASLRAE